MQNVDLDMHHMVVQSHGSWKIPSDTPTGAIRYVSFVVGVFNGTLSPQHVKVEKDYGRLVVRHYRPIANL
jgi:hypothetical protein